MTDSKKEISFEIFISEKLDRYQITLRRVRTKLARQVTLFFSFGEKYLGYERYYDMKKNIVLTKYAEK